MLKIDVEVGITSLERLSLTMCVIVDMGCRLSPSICIIFFSDAHVFLPFDEFVMSVLSILNVVLVQVHLNSWVLLQAF